jgi:hypothetical protein
MVRRCSSGRASARPAPRPSRRAPHRPRRPRRARCDARRDGPVEVAEAPARPPRSSSHTPTANGSAGFSAHGSARPGSPASSTACAGGGTAANAYPRTGVWKAGSEGAWPHASQRPTRTATGHPDRRRQPAHHLRRRCAPPRPLRSSRRTACSDGVGDTRRGRHQHGLGEVLMLDAPSVTYSVAHRNGGRRPASVASSA